MSLGAVFYILGLILFLFAWVGSSVIPNPIAGGLFCVTLGLLLQDVPIATRRSP
ncbi:MAG TPA: hypothetical protein VKD72_28100 [Gemmataceae bacterium]|nr:hypothetical protein [Gemmataceae bacterium]